MRNRNHVLLVGRICSDEIVLLSEAEPDAAIRKFSDPHLRSLQIPQNRQRTPAGRFGGPHGVQRFKVSSMFAMAEIEPENIDTGIRQGPHFPRRPATRPERCDDLGILALQPIVGHHRLPSLPYGNRPLFRRLGSSSPAAHRAFRVIQVM